MAHRDPAVFAAGQFVAVQPSEAAYQVPALAPDMGRGIEIAHEPHRAGYRARVCFQTRPAPQLPSDPFPLSFKWFVFILPPSHMDAVKIFHAMFRGNPYP